jgi:hypothetical protein
MWLGWTPAAVALGGSGSDAFGRALGLVVVGAQGREVAVLVVVAGVDVVDVGGCGRAALVVIGVGAPVAVAGEDAATDRRPVSG